MTMGDNVTQVGANAYAKAATGLNILRETVMGRELFDFSFREYARRWAFKHPTAWDFFHTIENVAGEDLNWFWRSWALNTWKFDVAVKEVDPIKNGAMITLQLLEKMPMPLTVKVVDVNGDEQLIKLPVEVWQRGDTWSFPVQTKAAVKEVVVDPEKRLPDMNTGNNSWMK